MITLPIKKVKEALDKIFTSNGYSVKDINIKFPDPLSMTFGSDGTSISLSFLQNLPKISWKKFITISALIEGIKLSDDGGTIKIKYFPDLKFTYSKDKTSTEELFMQNINISDIEEEIKAQYPDTERRKIANLCLQYANEWATICTSSGLSSQDFKSNEKRLKKDCANFVKDSIREEKAHGSFIISFIVIYVLLPVILKWIIEKIFSKLTS